jgi:hypothetical protein
MTVEPCFGRGWTLVPLPGKLCSKDILDAYGSGIRGECESLTSPLARWPGHPGTVPQLSSFPGVPKNEARRGVE